MLQRLKALLLGLPAGIILEPERLYRLRKKLDLWEVMTVGLARIAIVLDGG